MQERTPSHFEYRSDYVKTRLREIQDHPCTEKLFEFAERPVMVIDVSEMDTELIHTFVVLAPYMVASKRTLTLMPKKDSAYNIMSEYEDAPLIHRLLPGGVFEHFGGPSIHVPEPKGTISLGCNLYVVYPTQLPRVMEKQPKEAIDLVVIVDTPVGRRFTSATHTVMSEYSGHAKILLLTTRPETFHLS